MKKLYSNQMLFIILLLGGGLLCGVLSAWIIPNETLSQLDSILIPMNESFNQYNTFLVHFVMQVLFILILAFIGTSFMGTFSIAIILFVKGLQVGVTSMMFLYTYQFKGILGIIMTLLPNVILDILPILVMSIFVLKLSSRVLFVCMNPKSLDFREELNKGLNYLIASLLLALVFSYLKASLIIQLIRFFNHF